MSVSLSRRPWHARSKAIMLLEQAESKLTQGPVKLKNQLKRAANMLGATPVAVYIGRVNGSLLRVNL